MLKYYRKINVLKCRYDYYEKLKLIGSIYNKILFKRIISDCYKTNAPSFLKYLFIIVVIIFGRFTTNFNDFILMLILSTSILCFLSHFITYNIYDLNNKPLGKIKSTIFSNIVNIYLVNDKYEIYSHGGNYFSVMKNDVQIALINSTGKVIVNELHFNIECKKEYTNIIILIVMIIDYKYYGFKLGKKVNLLYSWTNTFNFNDRHRERLFWKNIE